MLDYRGYGNWRIERRNEAGSAVNAWLEDRSGILSRSSTSNRNWLGRG
jgi:hypothetical protein